MFKLSSYTKGPWDLAVANAITEALLTGLPSVKIYWGFRYTECFMAVPDGRVFAVHCRARGGKERQWLSLGLPSACKALARTVLAMKKRGPLLRELILWSATQLRREQDHRDRWLRHPWQTFTIDPCFRGALVAGDLYACADMLEEQGATRVDKTQVWDITGQFVDVETVVNLADVVRGLKTPQAVIEEMLKG